LAKPAARRKNTAAKKRTSRNQEPAISNRERPETPERFPIEKDSLLAFYKEMLLIRRFEEKAGQLYGLVSSAGFVTYTLVKKLLSLAYNRLSNLVKTV